MHPIHRIEISATITNRLSSRAQRSVGSTVESRMISPPIVGVPRLLWWLAGPSARITCPTLCARSRRMIAGPMTKARSSAVTTAPAARKLM
jgi:hypothetical protein